jgi:hypothetical protein
MYTSQEIRSVEIINANQLVLFMDMSGVCCSKIAKHKYAVCKDAEFLNTKAVAQLPPNLNG